MLFNKTLYAISLLALLSTTSYLNAVNEPDQSALISIQQTCAICYDDKDTNECTTLTCNHTFCTQCLQHILDNAIAQHSTETVRCPNPECAKNMELTDFTQITNNQEKIVQLLDLKAKEWLTKQKNVKQCPTPDCNFAFINDATCSSAIECPQCKKEYCTQCLITHGFEISCEQAREQKLAAEDQANQTWKQANTKQCPSCKVHIEKNDGCNHMTCKKCKYEFCWLCLYPRSYGSHVCPIERPEPTLVPVLQPAHRNWARIPDRNEPRTVIVTRCDMPRDYEAFYCVMEAAGIEIRVNLDNTLMLVANNMSQENFNIIMDHANMVSR